MSQSDCCTCRTSTLCIEHNMCGAPLGSDKVDDHEFKESIFVIIDAYHNEDNIENYAVESYAIEINSVHRTFQGAHQKVLVLLEENFNTFNKPYEQTDEDAQYVAFWKNTDEDYIAIQELTLED